MAGDNWDDIETRHGEDSIGLAFVREMEEAGTPLPEEIDVGLVCLECGRETEGLDGEPPFRHKEVGEAIDAGCPQAGYNLHWAAAGGNNDVGTPEEWEKNKIKVFSAPEWLRTSDCSLPIAKITFLTNAEVVGILVKDKDGTEQGAVLVPAQCDRMHCHSTYVTTVYSDGAQRCKKHER